MATLRAPSWNQILSFLQQMDKLQGIAGLRRRA